MTAPLGGYVLKDATLTIEGTNYTNQCRQVMLTPEQATQTYKTLVPDGVAQDVDTPTWTCTVAGLQDYVDNQGLARYLTENAGLQLDVVFVPKNGGVSAALTVVAKAVPFGGTQGTWAEFDIELPCVGAPVFTDPV